VTDKIDELFAQATLDINGLVRASVYANSIDEAHEYADRLVRDWPTYRYERLGSILNRPIVVINRSVEKAAR
jgi:hypothetical protein